MSEDLIIKGAKGIKDGLYVIKGGELFKYKSKGGTVRTYLIVDRPIGEWMNDGDDMPRCSNCGYITEYNVYIDDYFYSHYCPNCGADMRGEDE